MKEKIHVGLIYGGESFEHEVSKMTAESIRKNIDHSKFDVTDIYISKTGDFDEELLKNIDIAFLAVHGPNCEDGKLQRYLEEKKIKYTGAGIDASEINMDKILMHEYFKRSGLKTVDFIGFTKNQKEKIPETIGEFGFPVYVKPNNTGSSVGISMVANTKQLEKAVKFAFEFNDKIIIEKAIENPKEVEVGILGNEKLDVSNPGEILSYGKFYSYEAKYLKPFETKDIASGLTKSQIDQIKNMAKAAYVATECTGYARVDFLIDREGKVYINEINTLPGFTKISMFPKLMKTFGYSYKILITKIIELGLKR